MYKICIALFLTLLSQLAFAEQPRELTLHGRVTAFPLDIHLSDADWRWLGKKQRVTIATWDSVNPPLDIALDSGIYEGIFADYLKIIITNLGIRCSILRFPNREQALDALAEGKVDIMVDDPGVSESLPPQFRASKSFINNRIALVTQQSAGSRPLTDKPFTLAVSDTYLSSEQISALFPEAEIFRFSDNAAALAAVAYHKMDAALGNLTSLSFLIDRNFNNELTIKDILPETGSGGRLVLRRGNTSLLNSINAVVSAFPPHMSKVITDEWFLASNYDWLSAPDTLTAKEKAWIKAHPVVDVLASPFYAPLTLQNKDNEFHGISSDVLNLISLRTGLKFRLRAVNDLSTMVSEVSQNDAAMLAALTWSSERARLLTLSRPYFFSSYVLIVTTRETAPTSIRPDMTLALTSGNAVGAELRQRYPDIHIVEVANASLALKMVEEGKADAAIHNLAGADFLIDRYFKGRLKIATQLGIQRAEVSFALNHQQRELESILNKTLADIPPRELAKIAIKWQGMPVVNIEIWRNYSTRHFLALVLSVLVIIGIFVWALTLRREVLKRQKAQLALSHELEFREVLLNGSPEPIYVLDQQGRITSCNHAWQFFFLSTDPQVLALPLFDSRHPLSPVLPALLPLLNSEQADSTMVHRQRCTIAIAGKEHILMHWAAPIPKTDIKTGGLVCGWEDISEYEHLLERLSEEKMLAEQASKAKGSFLTTMSHEIRTPVSAIIGLLELAESARSDSSPDGEAVRLAYTTAQSLLELIGDVLDLAKIESNSFELAPGWTDPVQLSQQTLAIFDGLARQKGLALQFDNNLTGEHEYWVDAQRLRQIIFNFLSNSLKFTYDGHAGIRLTNSVIDEQTQLIIEVYDTGIGIAHDDQLKLFRPYIQLDEGKKKTGTGLGLVISAELTRMMGGTLKLESALHRGTRITIMLPVESRQAAKAHIQPNWKPEISRALTKSLHILVVDDHDTNRLILRRQAERLGCRVTEAADGEEALLFVADEAFDLIITDCQMPVMDGIALTRAVRAADATIPVWGLTANAQPSERERCLAAGMDKCLFKPLIPADFKEYLQQTFPTGDDDTIALQDLTDFARIREIIGDNPAHMEGFMSRAIKNNREDFEILINASLSHDIKELATRVHRLVGAAEVLGASRLRDDMRTIETMLESDTVETIASYARTHLRCTLEMMEAALREFNGESK